MKPNCTESCKQYPSGSPLSSPSFPSSLPSMWLLSFAISIGRNKTQGFSSLAKRTAKLKVYSLDAGDRVLSLFKTEKSVLTSFWPNRNTGDRYVAQCNTTFWSYCRSPDKDSLSYSSGHDSAEGLTGKAQFGHAAVTVKGSPEGHSYFEMAVVKILAFWISAIVVIAQGWQDSHKE